MVECLPVDPATWVRIPAGAGKYFRSTTHRQGWPFSGGLNILNFNTFGFFFSSENEYFWGYEDFVDIFGSHHKNWTYFECHFCAF